MEVYRQRKVGWSLDRDKCRGPYQRGFFFQGARLCRTLMPDGTLENRIVHAEPILVRLIHQNFSEGKVEMTNLQQLKA